MRHQHKEARAAWVSEYDGLQVKGWPAGPAAQATATSVDAAHKAQAGGVFSLAVHSEGVWCVAGMHDGNVHLTGVRLASGATIHSSRPHKVRGGGHRGRPTSLRRVLRHRRTPALAVFYPVSVCVLSRSLA